MTISLVVEDGSIVAGANSYISLANAQAYWSNWGLSIGMNSDQQQTNALFYAAYAMDKLFGRMYVGHLMKDSPQALLWPRQGLQYNRPFVQITDATGFGARAVARVLDGAVQDVFMVEEGAGYTAPVVKILDWRCQNQTASVTANLTSGAITSMTVNTPGNSYISAPSFKDNNNVLVYPNTIPQQLMDAQSEFAMLYLNNPTMPQLFPNESDNRLIRDTRNRFGTIDISVDYWNLEVDQERYTGFRKVELLLWPILLRNKVVV
jgi:hypothetical protein